MAAHEAAGGDVHTVAVAAETNLEKLATLLGQGGADPGAVDAVTKMAGVVRKIVLAIGQPPAPAPAAAQPSTIGGATQQLHQSMQAGPPPQAVPPR